MSEVRSDSVEENADHHGRHRGDASRDDAETPAHGRHRRPGAAAE